MKVVAATQVSGSGLTDKELKTALGAYLPNPPRRVDRLTLIALLAAAPMQDLLQADSGLYLAATYPARPNMFSLLGSVCAQHKLPKPFEFVNSVSNAAGFHVAQQLGINGPNLFIGASSQVWAQLLELADCDLDRAQVRQALLVFCDEDDQGGFNAQALLLENGGDALSGRDFAALSSNLEVMRQELTGSAG